MAASSAPERILQRLDWQVVRRLDGVLHGDYRTLFRGFGLDFAGLREYPWGPAPRPYGARLGVQSAVTDPGACCGGGKGAPARRSAAKVAQADSLLRDGRRIAATVSRDRFRDSRRAPPLTPTQTPPAELQERAVWPLLRIECANRILKSVWDGRTGSQQLCKSLPCWAAVALAAVAVAGNALRVSSLLLFPACNQLNIVMIMQLSTG